MAIVAYICPHKISGVALCAIAANKYYCEKWVWLIKKTNTAVAFVIALPYYVFLNFASDVIQSRIIFKAVLTHMTWTKHDPGDDPVSTLTDSFESCVFPTN